MKAIRFRGGRVIHVATEERVGGRPVKTRCGKWLSLHADVQFWKPMNNNLERSAYVRKLAICSRCYKPMPKGAAWNVETIGKGCISISEVYQDDPSSPIIIVKTPLNPRAKGFYVLAEAIRGYDMALDPLKYAEYY